MEPFVRYKKLDLIRDIKSFDINMENNLLKRDGVILSTSDVYDSKTNRYYSKYRDHSGKIVEATVVLTLGKGDYQLFQERYNVKYLKVLDGCYFVDDH